MAATDILTVTRAKEVLGTAMGDPRRHLLLDSMVTAVSEHIDRLAGPVVRRTITGETHYGVCGRSFRLNYSPVHSVTSLAEWRAGTSTALTAETTSVAGGYLLEPYWQTDPAGVYSGVVYRRRSWGYDRWDSDVVVSYVAGRYEDTEAAQDTRFGQAAAVLLRFFWQSELFSVGTVGEYDVPVASFPRTVPRVVRELLAADIDDVLVG